MIAVWGLSILCIILGASIVVLYHQKEELLSNLSDEQSLKNDKHYFLRCLEEKSSAYAKNLDDIPDIKKCKSGVTVNFKDNIFTVNISSTYERFDTKLRETRNLTVFYKIFKKGSFLVDDTEDNIPDKNLSEVYKFISDNLKYNEYCLGDSRAFLHGLDEHMFRGTLVCSGQIEGTGYYLQYLGGYSLILPYDLKELTKSIEINETSLKSKITSAKAVNTKNNQKIEALVSSIDDIDITVAVSEYMENTEEIMKLLSLSKNKKEFNVLYEPFKESSTLICSLLKEFWDLKKHKKLTDIDEKNLQDKIEIEVAKCSKLAKMEVMV